MTVAALPVRVCWNLRHWMLLIALLAVSLAAFDWVGTLLVVIIASPVLLAPSGRERLALFWLGACSPLFMLGFLYLTWIDGWIAIGHPPVAMLDDPKDIALNDGLDRLTALIWLLGLITSATILGFAIHRTCDPSNAKMHWFIRSYPLILVALIDWLSFGLLVWDPFDIIGWLMD